MLKRYLTVAFAFSVALCLSAQKAVFDSINVDVGTTLWKKPVTATFKFKNKERTPLRIENVDAMCGCVVSEWPKEALHRNDEGEIKITYDAMMLGHFDKAIDVYTNASAKPVVLRMKGEVSTSDRIELEELYPYRVGDICLNTNNIEFPDAVSGDTVTAFLELVNDGKDVYTPTLMHLPPYITAEAQPQMLARGRRGVIKLTLDSRKLMNMGLTQTTIYLARYSGDKVGEDNDISVSAVLLPDFPEEFSGLARPEFNISSTTLDFGKLGKKKKVSGEVVISNKGNAPLQLQAIQVFNHALSVSLPKKTLAPGESINMKVTLMSKYLGQSKSQPRVLLITNDPKCPKEIVTVKFQK